LTGHLGSHVEKYAAERAAQRVKGVKALAVEITVKLPAGQERTDAEIALAAERGLEWSALVPGGKIKPMVEGGWVTLNGEVEWEYQRQAAENAVRNLMGVTGVSNLVKITPQVDPSDIEKKLHDALVRQADREAERIQIAVSGQPAWQGSLMGRVQRRPKGRVVRPGCLLGVEQPSRRGLIHINETIGLAVG
jgi:osmotically-inducible protein OsmY